MPARRWSTAFLTTLLLLAASTAMAIEEPSFRVLEKDDAFELREYAPHLIAETRVEADFETAGNVAFRRLFRYISGENAAQRKIAMTAPVTQTTASERGEKIAMTAPVAQQADGMGYRVAFVVPAKYTLDSVPQPRDPTVRIRAVPAQLTASWRYSGRWTAANYQQYLAELRSAMASRDLVATGEPILARYDPPFKPSFLRRNEILIRVKRGALPRPRAAIGSGPTAGGV